jgi:hypothetical protein
MMIKPDRAKEYADYLSGLAQKRTESYNRQIDSIIDFFISTELAKNNLTFDGLIEKAKDKIKLQAAGPRVKLSFEEGVLFGAKYPEIVSRVMSHQHKTSSFDWEKAKLMGLSFNIDVQEPDLEFLGKWAVYNIRKYANECFPEFIAPLGL